MFSRPLSSFFCEGLDHSSRYRRRRRPILWIRSQSSGKSLPPRSAFSASDRERGRTRDAFRFLRSAVLFVFPSSNRADRLEWPALLPLPLALASAALVSCSILTPTSILSFFLSFFPLANFPFARCPNKSNCWVPQKRLKYFA